MYGLVVDPYGRISGAVTSEGRPPYVLTRSLMRVLDVESCHLVHSDTFLVRPDLAVAINIWEAGSGLLGVDR